MTAKSAFIRYIETTEEKTFIASHILSQLPDWFGIPESTLEYVKNCADMPFWAMFIDDKAIGFISLKEISAATAEIYVMGILEKYHGQGFGRMLWNQFLAFARQSHYEYIQVKTVKKGYYQEYDKTNAFYEALGFREFECLPTLWAEANPSQIYVHFIGNDNPVQTS